VHHGECAQLVKGDVKHLGRSAQQARQQADRIAVVVSVAGHRASWF
jgi:hypothetical protein